MSLRTDLLDWNGKSVADIAAIYEQYCRQKSFSSNLIQLLQDDALQKGATWLLKRFFEDGGYLNAKQIDQIYCQLQDLMHWEAKLHILQSLSYMPVSDSMKEPVEVFVRQCLMSSQKFVKAWAYNGFYELAVQYPELRDEAKQFMQLALNDEPASVKARVRKILAKGF